MRGRRNTHFWCYAGVSNGNERGEFKGELAYCDLCNKYAVNSQTGQTFISKKMYLQLKVPGSENC